MGRNLLSIAVGIARGTIMTYPRSITASPSARVFVACLLAVAALIWLARFFDTSAYDGKDVEWAMAWRVECKPLAGADDPPPTSQTPYWCFDQRGTFTTMQPPERP